MNFIIKPVFITLFFCVSCLSQAQEIITGLVEHPQIIRLLHENPHAHSKTEKNIPVKMPFIDDFSTYYGFPHQDLWIDNYVFVSDGFGKENITIGCATFDAFDEYGQIYEYGSTFPFIADYLTSQPIRLDSIFTGTPHIATPADSIYLSFFYQPQGYGDKPEAVDSLVVQFYNPVADQWNTVWSTPGMSYQQFVDLYGVSYKPVMIPVLDADYFSPDFQFRFYNIASLANNAFTTWVGNVDHWNIDYVYLNSGRTVNDTFPEDVAFRLRINTLLKDYSYMPWSHYVVNGSSNMLSSIAVPYMNYSNTLLNLTEKYYADDLSGTTSGYESPISASNLAPLTDTVFFRSPLPYTYNSLVLKNAEFLVRLVINSATIPDLIRDNDTLRVWQRFYNYFAYDDGTPEAGYGLVGAQAKLAYQFTLSHSDTLKSVMMQFNKVYNDANEDLYFNLMVWDDDNGTPGNIIYEQSGLNPVINQMYGFHNYVLNNPVAVAGTIYVGWKQQDSESLNIGYDRNTNRGSKIFFNTGGGWLNSMYEGALMIRIIVGSDTEPYVGITPDAEQLDWYLYPNPALSGEDVYLYNADFLSDIIRIYSADGQLVYEGVYDGQAVNVRLEAGVYFVSLYNTKKESVTTKKLIITR